LDISPTSRIGKLLFNKFTNQEKSWKFLSANAYNLSIYICITSRKGQNLRNLKKNLKKFKKNLKKILKKYQKKY